MYMSKGLDTRRMYMCKELDTRNMPMYKEVVCHITIPEANDLIAELTALDWNQPVLKEHGKNGILNQIAVDLYTLLEG